MDALKSVVEKSMMDNSSPIETVQDLSQKKSAGKKRWLMQGIGILISLFCLWLMFRQIKFNELQTALSNLEWQFIPLGIASLALGYAFRIYRWALMLRAGGSQVTNLQCAAPFLGSIALNNLLPFRAGDIIRALVFPAAIGVSRVTVTASLMLERLIDLLTLLLSLGIGLYLSSLTSLPGWMGKTVFMLAVIGSMSLFLVIVFSQFLYSLLNQLKKQTELKGWLRIGSVIGVAAGFIRSLGEMCRLRTLFIVFLVSMLVWAGEAGLFFAFLKGLGIHAEVSSALMMMAVATLSTLLPSSPGYVGPFHLAIFSVMSMLGGTAAQAASFAVLVHLGLWLPSTLAGSVAMLTNPRLFKKN